MSARVLTVIIVIVAAIGIVAYMNQDSNNAPQPQAIAGPSLHEAALLGDTAAIQRHIQAGSNLNEKLKDGHGSTPLITAAVFGHADAAIALINGGADLEIVNNDGSTALHTAAFFCRVEIVEALLANGANREVRNNMGSTAHDSVVAPYEAVEPIYQMMEKMLAPLGLKIDYDYVRATRPKIAQILES